MSVFWMISKDAKSWVYCCITSSESVVAFLHQSVITLTAFIPGSTVGVATLEESQSLIAECINRAHKETERVVIVVENMVRLLANRTLSHFSSRVYCRPVQAM